MSIVWHSTLALCLCCPAVMIASCQARQKLNELVTNPVLRSEANKRLFMDNRVHLLLPTNVTVESKSFSDLTVCKLKRDDEVLCDLHISPHQVPKERRKAKNISVGLARHFLETKTDNNALEGEILIQLKRKEPWFYPLYDFLRETIWRLRMRLFGNFPSPTKK